MPMQKFYAALLFGLLLFLPGNFLLAQETITSTGNYIDFSGNGFAAVPAIYPPPTTNNALTFESWVYIDNLPQDSESDILYYLTDSWGVYLQRNGKIGFRYRVDYYGNWPDLQSNSTLSPGEWYHLAATYSKTEGAMKIYINGVLDASAESSRNMTYISDNRSNIIGARRQNSSSTATGHFDGRFKHLRIWSTARSSTEINDNKSKVVSAETNLLRYYKFDEGQGNTVKDYSDYKQDASLEGDYTWGDISNKIKLHENGITVSCEEAAIGEQGTINGKTYTVVDLETLKNKISNGNEDLDCLCTTHITNMNNLFENISTSQDISSWDTSNVTSMRAMFKNANVSSTINKWNTGKVTDMYEMFGGNESFNQDISDWDTGEVILMTYMFSSASAFNQDIGGWNVSNVTDMRHMFGTAVAFNQDISQWDTSKVTSFSYMFNGASQFNQPLDSWDTSSATAMDHMFRHASNFNQDLNNWDTSNVTNIRSMFIGASSFNGKIGNWDTKNITDLSGVFYEAFAFNQDISSWDVSSATTMWDLFKNAKLFNHDIGNWDVSSVTNMLQMFNGASSFSQDLTKWCVSNFSNQPDDFATNSGLNDSQLPIWGTCPSPATLSITTNDSDNFITSGIVTITATFSENMAASPYISIAGQVTNTAMTQGADSTTWTYYWQVPSSVTTGIFSVTVVATDTNSNPYVGDESLTLSVDPMFFKDTNGITIKCSGCSAGNTGYIDGQLYTAHDNNSINTKSKSDTDWDRVVTTLVTDMSELFNNQSTFNQNISSWDTSNVTTMYRMFKDASNFNQEIGAWNVSNVVTFADMFLNAQAFNKSIGSWSLTSAINTREMFNGAIAFNQNLANWDLFNVTNTAYMFKDAASFNQAIGNWDTGNVISMEGMFYGATSFNQDISTWDVAGVEDMDMLFWNAKAFNQNISSWDISNVSAMEAMFKDAIAFDQDLSNWCVINVNSIPSNFALNSALSSNKYPQWGGCDSSPPTVVLSQEIITSEYLFFNDELRIKATFSEPMQASPTITISGGFASNVEMTSTGSSTIWTYDWKITTSVSTQVQVSVAGKDLIGNSYAGTNTLNFYIIANPTGDGTENNPYQIESLDDLRWLSKNESEWSKYFKQTAHIDASKTDQWNDSSTDSSLYEGFSPIGNSTTAFKGTYNGQNFTISGLTINRPNQEYVGLFGYAYTASISNLRLINALVRGKKYVGTLIGATYKANLSNLHATGGSTGDIVTGGLIGLLYNYSTLEKASFSGEVKGNTGDSSDYYATGGLLGKIQYISSVSKAWSDGNVTGNYMVGGFVGQNSFSSLTNNYAHANATADYHVVGGFIGWNQTDSDTNGPVSNFSTGKVVLNNSTSGIGGFAGYWTTSSFQGDNNYWDSTSSTQESDKAPSSISTGYTTANMKEESTYDNWDFENTWIISGNINDGYPFLRGNNELDINDIRWDKENSSLIIDLTEAVYSSNDGEQITKEDFNISINDPNGGNTNLASLSSATPLALDLSNDNKTLTFKVSPTGTFDGDEELQIRPSNNNNLYDENGVSINDDLYVGYFLKELTSSTVSLTHNPTETILYEGETAIITATFSTAQSAASLSISGIVTDTLMTASSSPNIWYYTWTVPATASTTVSIQVSGTNTYGNPSTSLNSLTFTLNPIIPNVALLSLTHTAEDSIVAQNELVSITAIFSDSVSTTPTLSLSALGNTDFVSTENHPMTQLASSTWGYLWTVPSSQDLQEISATVSLSTQTESFTNSITFIIDNSSPNATLETNQEDRYLKAGETITVTATFSENISGECILDISNDVTSTQISMSAVSSSLWTTDWTIPYNWNQGNFSLKIATANDVAGNAYTGTASQHFIYDNVSPTLELSWDKNSSSFKGGETITFTASFNEEITLAPTFALSGLSSAVFSATNSPSLWKYTLVVPQEINTTASLSITAQDPAGNSLAYTHPDAFEIDSSSPALVEMILAEDNTSLKLNFSEAIFSNALTSSSLASDTFSLSVNGGNLSQGDITIEEQTLDGATITLSLALAKSATGDEILQLNIKPNSLFDQAGNAVASQQNTNTLTLFDTTPPQIEEITLGQTNSTVLIKFTEEITAPNIDDINVSIIGGTANLSSDKPLSISAINSLTYAIEIAIVGSVSGEEIVQVDVVTNTLADQNGNFIAHQQNNNSVQLKDTTAPIILLSDDQNDTRLAGNDQVLIIATSSEALAFAPTLIFSNQTTATLSTTASPTQWEYTWTVPAELNGTISIAVEGIDLDNNINTQSSSLTYSIDNSSPNATLETNQEDRYLKAGETITVTATFSENISGECILDISNDVTSTQISMSAVSSSLWTTDWTIPYNWNQGNFSLKIATANDVAGNAYTGTASQHFIYDNVSPTLELSWDKNSSSFKGGETITFTASFNEEITLAPTFALSGLSSAVFSATNSPSLWKYTLVVPQEINTTASLSITAQDPAGNSLAYTHPDAFEIDSSSPALVEMILAEDNTSLKLNFSEAIFSNALTSSSLASDTFSLSVNGGNLSQGDITIEEQTLDGATITLSLALAKSATGDEILQLNIKPNSLFDQAGNAVASQQNTNTLTLFDTTPPQIEEIELIDQNILRLVFDDIPYINGNTSSTLTKDVFVFGSSLASSTAINESPIALEQNGKEIKLTFTLFEPSQIGEELIVQLASSIMDASGNSTSTLSKNNKVELILDQDLDGIPDINDACPNSPSNETVDENGCAESQKDNDEDGIANGIDACPDTPEGEIVDEKGCSALQRDPDQDGIEFPLDECPETPLGQLVDDKGCGIQDQDEDLDGVPNQLDECPGTPYNEVVDEKGCALIQIDTDLDGIPNELDECQETPFGQIVNEKGCSQREEEIKVNQGDDDQDGVINLLDRCPETLPGIDVDETGCSKEAAIIIEEKDSDFDGVLNENDLCPGTEKGVEVNAFGCPLSEIDSDFDKIPDNVDRCPNTPIGESVDEFGCSESQKENDLDLDGVPNELDRCQETPFGEVVDQYGCSVIQLNNDLDLDGVPNESDECPNTPMEETVDEKGCAFSQLDDDLDGVPNGIDRCGETPVGEKVDAYGCSENQLDTDDDNDGIKNSLDKCPNTPEGVATDSNGCPYKAAKIYGQNFEQIENKRDDDVSNIKILLGEIKVEDTNKTENPFVNNIALSISSEEDEGLFLLEGRQLYLIGGLDFEEKTSHRFTLEATNDKGISSTQEIVLQVLDIPNSVSRSSFNILVFNVRNEASGSKVSHTRYYNPKADRGVGKWKIKKKIVGGNDAGLFEIKTEVLTDGKTEVYQDYLDFITPPDYENPMDHNRDNIYEVDVININTEDGDSTQPIPVTQTNIVVPENSPTTIQLQSVPAAPTDDTDGDGINDILDNSPFVANPDQADSDGDGVGDVSDDADHDGVWNPFDECNNTPYDTLVDAKGCPIFYLSPTSFNITTQEKCAGENSIVIFFDEPNYQYHIEMDGVQLNSSPIATNNWEVENLSTGTYEVCITVDGQTPETFERCYTVNITDPQPLSVYGKTLSSGKKVEYSLNGGEVYTITHNGNSFQTDENKVALDLNNGINYIQITTGIECQGIFEEQIFTSAQVYVSPMPFSDQLTIFIGGLDDILNLELYTSNGRLIERHQKQLQNGNRTLSLNTSHLKPGSYVLKTIGETTLTSELIIKE